jgi:hypothetical protein
LCVLAAACRSGTSPSSSGLAGEWSGTTSQGRLIAFSISQDEKVTSITIGHDFNGCSGVQTFANLNLATSPTVFCIPEPCPPAVTSYRAFNFTSGERNGPLISINALFLSSRRAEGTVGFRDFPECGTVVGAPWTAAKR